MPTEIEEELAPSQEEVKKFAILDLPTRFDDLEQDLPDETKAVVDFDALLKQRRAVEQRLEAIKHIDPKWEYEGDDSKIAVRHLVNWFGHEVTWEYDYNMDEETAKKEAEHIQEKFAEILDHIKKRVLKECGNLGNLNVMTEVAGLLATPKENVAQKRMVERLSLGPDNSAASYSPGEGKIYVNDEHTKLNLNIKDLIETLVEEGFISDFESLHHEQIHSKQFPPPTERQKMVKNISYRALNLAVIGLAIKQFGFFETASVLFMINKMMPLIAIGLIEMRDRMESSKSHIIAAETHAYYGSGRFSGNQDIHTKRGVEHRRMFSSVTEFLEHMSKYSVMRNVGDTDKLIMAYDQIRRLYALGLDDASVGALTGKAKWKKGQLSYDKLGQKIEELMKAKGLTVEDVDNLVEAEDIKNIIYFEQVKAIAREELQKTYLKQEQLEEVRYALKIADDKEKRRAEAGGD